MTLKKRLFLYFALVSFTLCGALFMVHKRVRAPIQPLAQPADSRRIPPRPIEVEVQGKTAPSNSIVSSNVPPRSIEVQEGTVALPLGFLSYVLQLNTLVGGRVSPNDRVDVVAVGPDGDWDKARPPVLSNVLVIGAGLERDLNGQKVSPQKWIITLAIRPETGKLLSYAEHRGKGVALVSHPKS
jgi:hypothetical protein